MKPTLFNDEPSYIEQVEMTVDELADRFLMRLVPRVQQASAKPELQVLIAAVRMETR